MATVGCSYVEGLESAGLVATLKHFVGYSASRNARNMAPVSMGRREIVDVLLPPFEAAVVRGGARSVMNSYTDVDGVPCAADPWLLTDVLRTEWGFGGTVVADYGSVSMLETSHGTAASPADAARQALTAGLDVELPDTVCFGGPLKAQVLDGDVDVSLVDRAVRRVLRQKIELGLLDEGWTPETSIDLEREIDLDSPENRQVARELAERSVVLLERRFCAAAPGCRRSSAPPDFRHRALRRRRPHADGLLCLPESRAPSLPTTAARCPDRDAAARTTPRTPGRRDPITPAAATYSDPTAVVSTQPCKLPRQPMSAWRSSGIGPACSARVRPARVATPRISSCQVSRARCWTPCSPPPHRSSSSSCPGGPTRWERSHNAVQGWCRLSCPVWKVELHWPGSSRAG